MEELSKQLQALDGNIVVLKSLRYDGFYLDAHPSKIARVSECANQDLADSDWAKFIIHSVKDNVILLESLKFRSHYLDINTDKIADVNLTSGSVFQKIQFTFCPEPPLDGSWAQFRIFGQLDGFYMRSERWKDRTLKTNVRGGDMIDKSSVFNLLPIQIDDSTSFLVGSRILPEDASVSKTVHPEYGFRMLFPANLEEVWEEIARYVNNTEDDHPYNYSYEIGMSRTDSLTKSISNSLTVEMTKNASVSVGLPGVGDVGGGSELKVSNTLTVGMETELSKTKSTQEKTEISPTVRVGRTLLIYQKVVNYGTAFKFQSTNIVTVILGTEIGDAWLRDNAELIKKKG